MTDETATPTPHPEDQPDLLAVVADMSRCSHGVDFDVDECDECFRPVPQGTEDELPDGFSPKDFAVAVGALIRDAQEAILVDMLGGLDPNDEWRRMARNAAKAAVKIAVQRGWRPVQ